MEIAPSSIRRFESLCICFYISAHCGAHLAELKAFLEAYGDPVRKVNEESRAACEDAVTW